MYQIGLFSEIMKISIKTLRYYDEIGLLKPSKINTENGYRYYSTEQMYELHKILSLKQMGFSIKEILFVLENNEFEKILEFRKSEIKSEMNKLEAQFLKINNFILNMKEGFYFMYQAVLKDTPKCIVYYTRRKVKDFDSYFSLIPQIGEEVAKANPNLKCDDHQYNFIEYLDGQYKEKDFNIEYCEAVTTFGNETENIKFKELPSIKVTSVLHKGSYSKFREAYNFIYKWIEDNGYKYNGNPRECYIDGIWNKENEEDWLTEIQIPIEKI